MELTVSFGQENIFDGIDIDEDTSTFALSWRVDQLRAVRQSRFACLYLENRFATNVECDES